MGDALRRLFLSIGIALGLAAGQPDPNLIARVDLASEILAREALAPESSAEGILVVDARIENAFAPGALELVEAGTRVAIRFVARVGGTDGRTIEAEETRTLRYDIRSSRYHVTFDAGKSAALVDPQAARALASELRALRLCPLSDVAVDARIVASAAIGIIDSRGEWHDAPVLWNYFAPRAVLSYHRGADISPSAAPAAAPARESSEAAKAVPEAAPKGQR